MRWGGGKRGDCVVARRCRQCTHIEVAPFNNTVQLCCCAPSADEVANMCVLSCLQINSLVATVMAASTTTLRYPG